MLITSQDLGRIGQLGFRKWYEKQLVESHIWLVMAFLCLIVLMVGLELLWNKEASIGFVGKAFVIAFGGVVGWLAFRRYFQVLLLAESLGETALCPNCRHPSFRVVRHELPGAALGSAHRGHDLNREGLLVNCRHCHHQWRWGYPQP